MDSLISHIARTHSLARENLATEVLVYILQSSESSVVRQLIASYGMDGRWNSLGYRFELQRQASDERGIPDVQVKDANEELCALFESKFNARLTRHQPTGYLQSLPDGGLLLFIVPKRRQTQLFDKLLDKCRSSGCIQQMSVGDANPTYAVVDGKRLEVTSWDEILHRLTRLQPNQPSPGEQKNRMSDIEQLGRFCGVMDKQTFDPFSHEQIEGTVLSQPIHQLTWITANAIRECTKKKLVHALGKDELLVKLADDDSLYFGQDLEFRGAVIWMGLWVKMWREHGTTPFWIWLGDSDKANNKVGPNARSRHARLRSYLQIQKSTVNG